MSLTKILQGIGKNNGYLLYWNKRMFSLTSNLSNGGGSNPLDPSITSPDDSLIRTEDSTGGVVSSTVSAESNLEMQGENEKIAETEQTANIEIKSRLIREQYSSETKLARDRFLVNILASSGISLRKARLPEGEREAGTMGMESTERMGGEAAEEMELEEEEEGEKDKPKIIEQLADKDIGFAALGGYDISQATGLLDEQLMKLHPVRQFHPGQVYNPEELHPSGREKDINFRKRGRVRSRIYQSEDVNRMTDFKNLGLLNNYVSDAGQLLSRKETKLKSKVHKNVMRHVKLARSLALLPFLDRREEFKARPRRMEEEDIFEQ